MYRRKIRSKVFSLMGKSSSTPKTKLQLTHQLTLQLTLAISISATLYLKDDTLPLDSLTSWKLYWKLIEIIQVYPSTRHKFSTLFQNSGDLNWEVIYQIPHVVTLDTKTRIFQYKLVNRIIYTNKSLYKMKMIDSPLCTFCKISDESLEHLFCRFDFTVAFWMSVVLWLKSLHIAFDSLNDSDIIFRLTKKKVSLVAFKSYYHRWKN